MMKRIAVLPLVVLLLVAVGNASATVTLSLSEGAWSNPVGGTNINYVFDVGVPYGNGNEDQVWWGTDVGNGQSGLGFTGNAPPPQSFELEDPFEVGQLQHFNQPIQGGTAVSSVDLSVGLTFSDPPGLAGIFDFTLVVDETKNYPGPVDDIIYFPDTIAKEVVYLGGYKYTLELLGFGEDPDNLQDQFVSPEGSTNAVKLWGKLTQAPGIPAPGAILLGAMGTGLVGWLRRRRTL